MELNGGVSLLYSCGHKAWTEQQANIILHLHSWITHFHSTSFLFRRLLKYHSTEHHCLQRSRHKKLFFIARHDDGAAGGRIGLFPLGLSARSPRRDRVAAKKRGADHHQIHLFSSPTFLDPHLMGRLDGRKRSHFMASLIDPRLFELSILD